MFTFPRAGVFFAMCTCLAIALAMLVLPPDLFWAYLTPERYLTGARVFIGPAYVSDDLTHLQAPPSAVIAWRRIAVARDTAVFTRLVVARSAAARLYGLAGLRRLAPFLAERAAEQMRGSADTVEVNWACAEGRSSLASAMNELNVPGWSDSLATARNGCR